MLVQDVEKFYEYQVKKMHNLEQELAKTKKVIDALKGVVDLKSFKFNDGDPVEIVASSKKSIEKMVLEIGAQPGHQRFTLADMRDWIGVYYDRDVNTNAVSTAIWRINKEGLGIINKVRHGTHELIRTGESNV